MCGNQKVSRRTHRRCSIKRDVLKNLAKFTERLPLGVQLQACNLLNTDSNTIAFL